LGRAFGKNISVRRNDEGCACKRELLVGTFANGVHGGDIDLVFDGACSEECFPMGASLGRPRRLDRDEVGSFFGCFSENFWKPQVVADERCYCPIVEFK